jgi:hypothetical protein
MFFQENLVHQFDYAGISTLLYPAGSRLVASIRKLVRQQQRQAEASANDWSCCLTNK